MAFQNKDEDVFFTGNNIDISSILRISSEILKSAGISSARTDSELLLCKVLSVDRAYLYTYPEEQPDKNKVKEFSKLVCLRNKRIPLQYLVGKQEFWSRDFIVKKRVFIPRPETEKLIEIILADFEKILDRTKAKKEDVRIIDIGTGTGIIPITLKCELPFAKLFAADISSDAIKIAKLNAGIHLTGKSISFIRGRGFESLSQLVVLNRKAFHIIVSNPPYIPDDDIPKLEPEVAQCEPIEALSGGEEGTDMIKYLIKESPRYLCSGGMLIMETGEGQRECIKTIAESTGKYDDVGFYDDYSSKERVARLWIK